MTEQRYRAVLEVGAGVPVTEVAERFGVSRQAVHRWIGWYRDEGLDGLADRSHRPHAHPAQTSPQVEAAICELRRTHRRWGQRRLHYELDRRGCPGPIPSLSTIYRVLVRHALIEPVPRRRRREDYQRWERRRPMELWQMDIVGGVLLADGREAKVVTGVDDHSRFCVIAAVVPKATGRAVCLALVDALRTFGVPEELLTDNGKQFTARFNMGGGEVMFDRICRENGITHRLTKPRSPTTTGKVERFHQTLRRELLDDHPPFTSIADAQAAIDAFRHEYNTDRPHQSLDMGLPADRFTPAAPGPGMSLRLPNALRDSAAAAENDPGPALAVPPHPGRAALASPEREAARSSRAGVGSTSHTPTAVQLDRIVPPSGNLTVCGQQFWLGPLNAGRRIGLWADTTVIHLLLDGNRVKSVPSRLTTEHLRQLLAADARPAGPPPISTGPARSGGQIEVDRLVTANGLLALAGRQHPVGYHLAGRRVTARLDRGVLHLLDADRTLLRSLPNPLTNAEVSRLRDARPAGPPPTSTDAQRVDRRVSSRGSITIAGQRIHPGIAHAGHTVTVEAADTTFRVYDGNQLLTEVARTSTKAIARFKVRKPEPPRRHDHVEHNSGHR